MSLLIFSLIVIAAMLSRSLSLLVSGLIFAMLSMLHFKVFGMISGENYGYYYAGAAVFDCICVICICISAQTLGKDCHLLPLSIAILLSIANNLLGLFVWFFEFSSEVYAGIGISIYVAVAFILAGSRFNVGGIFRVDRISSLYPIPDRYRLLLGGQERVKCRTE